MNTSIIVVLIVIFGAALVGKMLKDIYPGSMSNLFRKETDKTPTAE
ncbi:hypothetical protein [Roseovarius faecimaris]|nr:hypothetical protein [Roseovarius faecimaris]